MTLDRWTRTYLSTAVGLGAAALIATGCLATEDDLAADAIAEALELENGGYDMEDEAPMFGDAATFDQARVSDAAEEVTDDLRDDAEFRRLSDLPDGVHMRVAIAWGQIPGNRENETGRNWSGSFSLNRGAMLVRRTIAFDREDHLERRDDRTVVPFTSYTLPHWDGLVLDVVAEASQDTPLVLTYTADRDDSSHRIPLADLLDGRVTVAVDDADNRMVAAAHARPLDVCDHGFLMGRWHRVTRDDEPARGRFVGRVVGEDGAPKGHVRGVYGERRDGSRVFFGKYINRAGEFQGVLAGTYGDGAFEGRWLTRTGERGSLMGRAQESTIRDGMGGHFLGRWQEHTCNVR